MIFVPNRDGISCSEAEFTSREQFARARALPQAAPPYNQTPAEAA
jgi:hypothetical protein